MPIGSFIVSETANNVNNKISIVNATNSFVLLSTPTFHNMAVTFSISNIETSKEHNLSLYLYQNEQKRKVFENRLNMNAAPKLPQGFVPSINGVITLGKLQIDDFGEYKLVMEFDGAEIDSVPILFTKGEPQK